jgi:hypothetical protein
VSRTQLERLVNGAITSCVDAHGPIDRQSNLYSATKRILGSLEEFLTEEALSDEPVTPVRTKGWRASKEWRESCPRCHVKLSPRTVETLQEHYAEVHNVPPKIEGNPNSLTARIERALLRRHPVTLAPERARNYAEIATFVAGGGS